MNQSNKKKLIIKFFIIVFTIVGVFLILSGFILGTYLKTRSIVDTSQEIESSPAPTEKVEQETKETQETQPPTISKKEEEYKQLTVAVFGVDKTESLTDVIFIVRFDSKTKKIDILSIPRDTRVKIPESRKTSRVPSDGYVKINEVYSYATKSNAIENSIKQIEELLNITLDNYVKINLTGFKNIVDAIGGVEMDVPQNMVYDDPEQNLHINLKKGMQTLNGQKSEQLVRFRKDYAQGDLKRIDVQHIFMKALIDKILNMDNLIKNAPQLAYNVIKYVSTDVGLEEILEYIQYIDDIKSENITMTTLPGTAKTLNGHSYYIHDTAQTQKLINEIFYSK